MDRLTKLKNKVRDLWKTLETHKATYEGEDRAATAEETTRTTEILDQIEAAQTEINTLERQVQMGGSQGDDPPSGIQVGDEPADRGFDNFGDFLLAVRDAENPGRTGQIDQRLLAVTPEGRASGMSEGVAADGGFLVKKDHMQEIIAIAEATGILFPKVKRIPIGANANGLKANYVAQTSRADGSRWGGVQMYWKGEAQAFTSSAPKFGLVDMSLQKVTGLYYATDELLMDATALGALAKNAFGEELGFKLDDAIINGTGAGMPLGIMNAPCLVSVAKETGQAADTVVAENIEKAYARMYGRGKKNADWCINGDVWPQLWKLQRSAVTGGIPIFMPPGGLSAAPLGMLLGRPIEEVEQCATLGDAGDIIFGDFTQYLLIEKGDPKFESSMHVRFVYDELTFRLVYRANGQPIWQSAVTPYKGSATRSPFIRIAARA